MLEQWYNIQEKRPDLKHKDHDEVLYSDPIFVMIDDALMLARYTKQIFYNDNNDVEWDEVLELASFDMEIFKSPFVDSCFTIEDLKLRNNKVYWSPLNMTEIIQNLVLTKKEGSQNVDSIITGETN